MSAPTQSGFVRLARSKRVSTAAARRSGSRTASPAAWQILDASSDPTSAHRARKRSRGELGLEERGDPRRRHGAAVSIWPRRGASSAALREAALEAGFARRSVARSRSSAAISASSRAVVRGSLADLRASRSAARAARVGLRGRRRDAIGVERQERLANPRVDPGELRGVRLRAGEGVGRGRPGRPAAHPDVQTSSWASVSRPSAGGVKPSPTAVKARTGFAAPARSSGSPHRSRPGRRRKRRRARARFSPARVYRLGRPAGCAIAAPPRRRKILIVGRFPAAVPFVYT